MVSILMYYILKSVPTPNKTKLQNFLFMCRNCIQMPPKKKHRVTASSRVTASNHWSTIATLSKSNAVLAQQKEHYEALLKQLGTIIDKEWTRPPRRELVHKQVSVWIAQAQERLANLTTLRDKALISLRTNDVLDNDTLTTSAATLTEKEMQLRTQKGLLDKFERVVRYKSDSTLTLAVHADNWITRFIRQWDKTNAVFNKNILMLRESVVWLEARFSMLVQIAQSEPCSPRLVGL